MRYPSDEAVLSWYALAVRPSSEIRLCQVLNDRGIEAFCPTYHSERQWTHDVRTVELPLFSGFVFCRLDSPAPPLIPEVQTALAVRGAFAAQVAATELEMLRRVASAGRPLQPWPFLNYGTRVRIVSAGPLKDVEGILANPGMLVMSISVLHRSAAAALTESDTLAMATSAAVASTSGLASR